MSEKPLRGKIIKLYIQTSGNHKIPTFKVKLDNGKIVEIGRGDVSIKTFGSKYQKKTADEMSQFNKRMFYGLRMGDKIYISTQRNWD